MISLATALYASTCPPEGWEKADGNGGWTPAVWPPTASTYCISPYGWQGTEETNHCAGGTNALDGCCEFIGGSERLRCEPCTVPPAPTVCTGNAAIDEVLWRSELWCKIGLSDANSVYTWEGFCEAVRHFNEIDGDRVLNLGEGAGSPAAARDTGLANVAALLAQCMWESGGDQPFSSCDENDYRGWVDSACTQRGGKERYDALTDQPWACTVPRPGTEVDKTMRMKAVTAVLANPPLECVPGTVTEGCCWWGRGAIQTTGPNNYGLLQDEIVSQIPALAGVDLCKNPEAMCCDGRAECGGIEHREMRWLGAIFYWYRRRRHSPRPIAPARPPSITTSAAARAGRTTCRATVGRSRRVASTSRFGGSSTAASIAPPRSSTAPTSRRGRVASSTTASGGRVPTARKSASTTSTSS